LNPRIYINQDRTRNTLLIGNFPEALTIIIPIIIKATIASAIPISRLAVVISGIIPA